MTATAMTQDEILAELQEICREVFENPDLTISEVTTAEDVPHWDSLNHLNVVATAEQRFGIRFRTSEIEGLKNVGDFIALVTAKQKR
jgi:acyl carrier protein